MNSTYEPTPEMLEVLEAVERAPRSKLLRPPLQLGRPSLGTETWTGGEPFLSSAERKLVRAYREEAETYYFFLGQSRFLETDWAKNTFWKHQDAEIEARRFINARSQKRDDWEKVLGGKAKEHVAHPGAKVEDAFRTALFLIPKYSTRIFLGLVNGREGRLQAAEQGLKNVLAAGASDEYKSIAATNLGLLYWEQGKFADAAMAYHWSHFLDANRNEALLWSISSAYFAGRTDLARGFEEQASQIGLQPDGTLVKDVRKLIGEKCDQAWRRKESLRIETPELGILGTAILGIVLGGGK